MITYKLSNGVTLTGTPNQVIAIARQLGFTVDLNDIPVPSGYYLSQSRGLIRISEMTSQHLRNAYVKSATRDLELWRRGTTGVSNSLSPKTLEIRRELEGRMFVH